MWIKDGCKLLNNFESFDNTETSARKSALIQERVGLVSTHMYKQFLDYQHANVNTNEIFFRMVDNLQVVVDSLKEGIVEFDKKLKGFAYDDAVMIGIESRSSCPIRMLRDESRQSNIKGIYPIGEGAGYAGGITSAALDGLITAMSISKDKN